MGINPLQIVPHQACYIVEQLGRYHKTLLPGFNIIFPGIQRVMYRPSLKEQSYQVLAQNAVTKDNVVMQIDGVLYLRVKDPVLFSYGAQQPIEYTHILAQSIMRSEIGKLTLDQTFEEREIMNKNILDNLKNATENWGIECTRYEIKDIKLSDTIRKVMNLEAETERKKRAEILLSEGRKNSEINMAIAHKTSKILEAEWKSEQILLNALAVTERIKMIQNVISTEEGQQAANFQTAHKYLDALKQLADPSKNIVIKSNISDVDELVKESLNILSKDTMNNLDSDILKSQQSKLQNSAELDQPKFTSNSEKQENQATNQQEENNQNNNKFTIF